MHLVGNEQQLERSVKRSTFITHHHNDLAAVEIGIAVDAVAHSFAQQLLFSRNVQSIARNPHGQNQAPGQNRMAVFQVDLESSVFLACNVHNVQFQKPCPETLCLTTALIENLPPAESLLHAAVVFDVGLIERALLHPPQYRHGRFAAGGVQSGLKSRRPAAQDDHINF